MTTKTIKLAWVNRHTEDAVIQILQECFPGKDWDYSAVQTYLTRPKKDQRNIIKCLNVDATVVGVVAYTLTAEQCLIRGVGVTEQHRRQHYGTEIFKQLFELLGPGRRDAFLARVSEYDLRAQLFCKSLGFRVDAEATQRENSRSCNACYVFAKKRSFE